MEWTPNKMGKQLASNIIKVIQLYSRAGFIIITILMDMEFEKLQPLLPRTNINISAPNEHMVEIEHRIRTVKEQCHGIMATLPFTYFPQQMIISVVQFAVMWLNALLN